MSSFAFDYQQLLPAVSQGGVVTIGNFDGVHRGHAALIAQAKAQAHERGSKAVVLTFSPHPRELLIPDKPQPLLTTTAERVRLLRQLGADAVVTLRTTQELLGLSAIQFFEQVIQRQLQAIALVEGENFCFGRKREGTIATLQELCAAAGLSLTIVPPVLVDGVDVSSSAVRNALEHGQVDKAQTFLGRCYRLQGTVGTGQRRGQTLGFPTANLEAVETLIPADGVYAVRAWVGDKSWPAACNIGPNPTFAEQARKMEVHLIGFTGNLYDLTVQIDFVARLRDTQRFNSVGDLTQQLRLDVAQSIHAVQALP